MTATDNNSDAIQRIADMTDGGADYLPPEPPQDDIPHPAEADHYYFDPDLDSDFSPHPSEEEGASGETLAKCAALDQSDTDNGKRLIEHFGNDLAVMAADNIAGGDFLVWSGKHWDLGGGPSRALLLAQKIGDLIQAEADYMEASDHEKKLIEAGEKAKKELPALMGQEDNDETREAIERCEEAIGLAKKARSALGTRKGQRRNFGVTSKNAARLKNMLECAAPHLRRPVDSFNADPMLVATMTHTLRFAREIENNAVVARCYPIDGHKREDYITALVPVAYDRAAVSPKWQAFLDRMMPDLEKRRTVQQFSGAGLLGDPLQMLMFHYGHGANGKSVYLEVLTRLLGDSFAVNLPTESIIGAGDRNSGSASPDIARLLGKRMVRILELPPGKPLQEDVVKRLTGGEKIPVRALFKGYFDFQPKAKPHMSGNGFPKIDGTDNGIWRRMLVVFWDVTLKLHEQRDFEEMVVDLLSEAPGILNWLIEGARDYLQNGLVIAPEIAKATQAYRDDMDVVGQFARRCVVAAPGKTVQARLMYQAFVTWCKANSKSHVFETKFGREMKKRFSHDETGRYNVYVDVALENVPDDPGGDPRGDVPPHHGDDDKYVPL